jgi:hypothetical protein
VYTFLWKGQFRGLYGSSGPSKSTICDSVPASTASFSILTESFANVPLDDAILDVVDGYLWLEAYPVTLTFMAVFAEPVTGARSRDCVFSFVITTHSGCET